MDQRVFRIIPNFETEEYWLNEQAAHGWMMKSFCMGVYHFEEGTPGSYEYRIELLPSHYACYESQRHMREVEAAGGEVVATWFRWVYYRRSASQGAFDIFPDVASRRAHYRRVMQFFAIFFFINVSNALLRCSHLFADAAALRNIVLTPTEDVVIAAIHVIGCLLFFFPMRAAYRQYKRLREEQPYAN